MCDLLTQYVELPEGQTHSSKMCICGRGNMFSNPIL